MNNNLFTTLVGQCCEVLNKELLPVYLPSCKRTIRMCKLLLLVVIAILFLP